MKETIATIPINDVFAEADGCPVCKMMSMLEDKNVDYITDAAVMVPDVRVETNRKGFCHRHYSMMIHHGKRLPNALLLETHLQDILNNDIPVDKNGKIDKKRLQRLNEVTRTCFVCDKIALEAEHMFNTICSHWSEDEEFRKIYGEQRFICLEHYKILLNNAQKYLRGKTLAGFCKATTELTENYLKSLKSDITHFCSMFDYRNQGGDWGNSKDSIERSITFLTGEEPTSFDKV